MAQRIMGTHYMCGGPVEYVSGGTWGMRRCTTCNADGWRGDPVTLLEDVVRRHKWFSNFKAVINEERPAIARHAGYAYQERIAKDTGATFEQVYRAALEGEALALHEAACEWRKRVVEL
jgi:hypothetical protein